ncbi:MAG: 2-oxo acid dehydrogenase subunit E2 [Ignavibacteriaceae bacterium]|nr:2-oxo acid dehydrogenase subunit E2 [Ignavibacteriaceae bacterium]
MKKEFKLPELGENIESADVLKLLVKKGDYVKYDQPALEIETDKATIEVPSTVEGIITEVLAEEGKKLKVGAVVFTVEESAAPEAEAPKAAEPAAEIIVPATVEATEVKTPTAPAEFRLPELGENIEAADVLKLLINVGDTVASDQPVMEIETDKATIEVPSTIAGTVTEILVKEGSKAKVGEVVFRVSGGVSVTPARQETKAAPSAEAPAPKSAEPAKAEPAKKEESKKFVPVDTQPAILTDAAPAAPSARRFARELGVDINKVPGTGPHGRISIDDIKSYVKKINLGKKEEKSGGFGIVSQPLPDFSKFGSIERKPMSNIRAKTAEHLSYAWGSIPHVTQFDKADITDLEAIRKMFAPKVEAKGAKLTVTAILIKIIAHALQKFPQFNASVDMENKEIIYKSYFNIGVAVDTDRGLIVPVINEADKKNITEISLNLAEISEKARLRKIGLEDLQGGCFTISNLGGIGGTYFTPIVNSPEVAILGVSRGAYEQVYKNGEFVPRLMLPLSLSYDHRVIDGADAIRFLRWVIEALEQPMKILIEG